MGVALLHALKGRQGWPVSLPGFLLTLFFLYQEGHRLSCLELGLGPLAPSCLALCTDPHVLTCGLHSTCPPQPQGMGLGLAQSLWGAGKRRGQLDWSLLQAACYPGSPVSQREQLGLTAHATSHLTYQPSSPAFTKSIFLMPGLHSARWDSHF